MIHGQLATDIINILGRILRKNKMQGNSIKVLELKLKWAQCGYCLLLIQSHSHNSCNSTESDLWYWYCTVYLHLQPFWSTLQCTMYKQPYYFDHSSVVPFKVTWYFREIMRNWCVDSQVVVITSTLCRCLFLSTILPFIAIDIPAELLPLLRELLWQMALQQTWLMPLTWIFQFFVITLLITGQQLDD